VVQQGTTTHRLAGGLAGAALLLAIGGCSPASPATTSSSASGLEPSQTPRAPSTTASPAPSEIQLTALELLDCDGLPNSFGDFVENHMRPEGGPTPQAVFDYWIAGQWLDGGNGWGVPPSGYEAPVRQGERYLYLYRVATEVKVVVVISPRVADMARGIDGVVAPQPIATDEVRMCDGAEYGPQAEFGQGERVWANGEGLILIDWPGSDHCGTQAARLMNIPDPLPFWGSVHTGNDYWADPMNVLPAGTLLAPYEDDANLPSDAVDSGYRHEDLELWLVPDGRAVYVVGPDSVELWPVANLNYGCS
jgi:hypothetical protein